MKLMNIKHNMMRGSTVFVIASFFLVIVEGQQDDYYQKEEHLFKKIELFYDRHNTNSSIIPDNEEAFGLIYLAYLTFWMSVNSKICFLLFSGELLHQDLELAGNCDINFNKLIYAFDIFKKNIEYFLDIANLTGHEYGGDGQIEFAAIQVLSLSLDFILIGEVSKKIGPDEYIEGIIRWSGARNVNVNGKYYKNIFPSYHYVRLLVQRELKMRKRPKESLSSNNLGRRPTLSKYNKYSYTTCASSSSGSTDFSPDVNPERRAWKEFIRSEFNPTIADIHDVLTENVLWYTNQEILDEIHDIFTRKIGGRNRYSKIINGFRDTLPENEKIWRLMSIPHENSTIYEAEANGWLVKVFNLIRLLRKLEQNV